VICYDPLYIAGSVYSSDERNRSSD